MAKRITFLHTIYEKGRDAAGERIGWGGMGNEVAGARKGGRCNGELLVTRWDNGCGPSNGEPERSVAGPSGAVGAGRGLGAARETRGAHDVRRRGVGNGGMGPGVCGREWRSTTSSVATRPNAAEAVRVGTGWGGVGGVNTARPDSCISHNTYIFDVYNT